MIFASKNEDGVPAIDLVLSGQKTVTRRTKPVEVGKSLAACPGRGKKALCRIRVLSCVPDVEWRDSHSAVEIEAEAKREGFKTWGGLWRWIWAHNPERKPLYRIEFEREKP